MDYKGILEKLERVIANCGVRISFIEEQIGIGRNTMSHYRQERLRFREDTQVKLKRVLDMYNV